MKKYLVLIPTYNEIENISVLIDDIFAQRISNLDVLVIDDNSPDGTATAVKKLIKKYKNIFLLRRSGKMGIGSAHRRGIEWAYKNGYKRLITMDSDLTHSPKYFVKLIKASEKYDLVIASRYLVKNSMIGWSFNRKLLTYLNHLLIRMLFSVSYDSSNAFRLYRLNKIPKEVFEKVCSKSYSFFYESLVIMNLNRVKIGEIPIIMTDRRKGSSKMRFADIIQHITVMRKLYINTLFRKKKLLVLKNV